MQFVLNTLENLGTQLVHCNQAHQGYCAVIELGAQLMTVETRLGKMTLGLVSLALNQAAQIDKKTAMSFANKVQTQYQINEEVPEGLLFSERVEQLEMLAAVRQFCLMSYACICEGERLPDVPKHLLEYKFYDPPVALPASEVPPSKPKPKHQEKANALKPT
ncbi:hypothetical protein BDP27DRAFT_1425542 [Rhodocollybia butyracea]|uniref:Uncharacterized protein n=1 Tax=Rhodocollybia butyracea TaxID=206335 RepID=A0A9P5PMF8_9AGAR|nr:hypothetical protein BDP27DRAFT_1425542 [Rhodocollybia butyracea]